MNLTGLPVAPATDGGERELLPRLEGLTVHVCAWCQPALTVFIFHPEWRGLAVSHSICARHLRQMDAEWPAEQDLPAKIAKADEI